jgi:uronate dehydrogenase
VHSIRGYPLGYEVKNSDITKPLNFYGASKAFGEALCHVFSHKYGMSCLAIRIGAFVPDHQKEIVCHTRNDYDYVISQRDLMQLVHKCIIAPDEVKFGILSGISNNKRKYMDLEFTKNLVGYRPKDDAFEICEEIKKRDKK